MNIKFECKNSNVPKSPHFEAIMKKYDIVGRSISTSKFHRDYVKPLDESISLRMWKYFIDKFTAHVDDRIRRSAKRALQTSEDLAVSEANLEARSMKKILAIADITLDELMENPELLAAIPAKERMTWLFSAMKARDSRTNVNIKKLTETRKTNLYEDLMKGAQYGAIDGEMIEDPAEPPQKEEPKQIVEAEPGIEIEINKEKREFHPNELE